MDESTGGRARVVGLSGPHAGLRSGVGPFVFHRPQSYLDNFSQAVTLDWVQKIFSGTRCRRALWWESSAKRSFGRYGRPRLGRFLVHLRPYLRQRVLLASWLQRQCDGFHLVMPLLIWILLPVGFVVTGLLQLRQGFAFAVMLYVSLRLNRPGARAHCWPR